LAVNRPYGSRRSEGIPSESAISLMGRISVSF
jgi:hypothetical protein